MPWASGSRAVALWLVELEGGRRGPGGVPPGPATRGKGEGDQVGDQRVITDHPPDHPLRSPSLGTKKVIRQGITPFRPYIILYRGGGRGGGFCLSTRGPSIVQGPTFQTGPLPEMGWSPLVGMVGWISGAEVHAHVDLKFSMMRPQHSWHCPWPLGAKGAHRGSAGSVSSHPSRLVPQALNKGLPIALR